MTEKQPGRCKRWAALLGALLLTVMAGCAAAPSGEEARPTGTTPAPSGEEARPTGTTPAPSGEGARPTGTTPAPTGEEARPTGTTASDPLPTTTAAPTETEPDVGFAKYRDGDFFDEWTYTGRRSTMRFLLHRPENPGREKLPLVIFLHGLGDEPGLYDQGLGNCLRDSLESLARRDPRYRCYILFPTIPYNGEGGWKPSQVALTEEMLGRIQELALVDDRRLYLTGISLGGMTTCRFLNTMEPETFAAAVPLSGCELLRFPKEHRHTGIRIYHCADDPVVQVGGSRNLDWQLKQTKHPDALYTEYPTGGHVAPAYRVYTDEAFYEWLFSRQLPPRETGESG